MQAMASLVLHGKCPVKTVVDYMHPGRGKLRSYLMGHSGADGNLEQRAFFVFDGCSCYRDEFGESMKSALAGRSSMSSAPAFKVDHFAEWQ